MFRMLLHLISPLILLLIGNPAHSLYGDHDWPRFRGPAGSGVAQPAANLPDTWSPTENLAWKVPLPGPGASSPIIVGDKVLVTCYSGYGLDREKPGQIENLVRHLVCLDLYSGRKLWQQNVGAWLPEDPYDKSGVSSHGYASHTPVSDGTHVYCFFGKGGVHAFDLDGKPLWQADAGKGSDPPVWGSSSSPVLFKDVLVVTAAAESQSLFGFDKHTGKRLWSYQSAELDGTWGTPNLVTIDDQRTDLVLLVPGELWGLDPLSGQRRWHCRATESQQAYTSVIAEGSRVFAFAGKNGGSLALDAGGQGDLGVSRSLWTSPIAATYATPVLHDQKIFVFSTGILTLADAETGQATQRIRLQNTRSVGNSRFGALDYASPVVSGQRLYWLNSGGQVFVFDIAGEVQQLAVNEVTRDKEVFWGSPAIARDRMVIRSSHHVYCISGQKE